MGDGIRVRAWLGRIRRGVRGGLLLGSLTAPAIWTMLQEIAPVRMRALARRSADRGHPQRLAGADLWRRSRALVPAAADAHQHSGRTGLRDDQPQPASRRSGLTEAPAKTLFAFVDGLLM
jgi:hypothetical protein